MFVRFKGHTLELLCAHEYTQGERAWERGYQQLVRATIGALVLGCPPLGNSRTCSYHAIGRYSLHMGPACAAYVRLHVSILTFAPVTDHVMPGDVTFTIGGYSCACAACGDDLIIYDVGNFSSHVQFTCVH